MSAPMTQPPPIPIHPCHRARSASCAHGLGGSRTRSLVQVLLVDRRQEQDDRQLDDPVLEAGNPDGSFAAICLGLRTRRTA